uniref:GAG-pre-integrase domain-containing protein n=1 Tax=Solanum lycopersicum TaxID=4081 RepID=A0A3Q7EXU1_SOLLC
MRICSGALVVMKAIRRNNNMYHYQGSTVIGTAATTSNDEKEAEMTKLWHMRLRHAGGKSLKTLLDQGLLKGVEFEGKIIFPTQGSNEETTENFPLEGEPVEEEEYLRRVLKRFGMNKKTKSVSTLLAPHFKLSDAMSPNNEAERE